MNCIHAGGCSNPVWQIQEGLCRRHYLDLQTTGQEVNMDSATMAADEADSLRAELASVRSALIGIIGDPRDFREMGELGEAEKFTEVVDSDPMDYLLALAAHRVEHLASERDAARRALGERMAEIDAARARFAAMFGLSEYQHLNDMFFMADQQMLAFRTQQRSIDAARADVERLTAEMEDVHNILLEHGCAPSPNGLRALIGLLSIEAEQARAAMTTPEGYVGQVKEALAEEVERLRAEVEGLRRQLVDAKRDAVEAVLFSDAALDCYLDDGPGKWWVQQGGLTIAEADTPVEAVRRALLAIRDRERNATPPWLTEYELLRRAGLVEQGRRLLALALQDGGAT